MRLLVDAQLPPALARRLTQGHDARYVFDVALSDSTDAVVWEHESSARLKPSRYAWLQ